MKKAIKITLLILAVVCALTAFTGCSSLDNMRAHRMDWVDGTHKEIEFNGKTYKKLPDSEYLCIDTNLDYDYFVSDKDVPLLLAGSEMLGSYVYITADKTIINYQDGYYASEDTYEKYVDIIKNAEFDRFLIWVECCDEEGYYCSEKKVLDEEICKIMNKALDTKIKEEAPDDDIFSYTDVVKCDSTGLMRSDWYELYCYENSKCIYLYDENNFYRLPDEYYDEIKAVIDMNSKNGPVACEVCD